MLSVSADNIRNYEERQAVCQPPSGDLGQILLEHLLSGQSGLTWAAGIGRSTTGPGRLPEGCALLATPVARRPCAVRWSRAFERSEVGPCCPVWTQGESCYLHLMRVSPDAIPPSLPCPHG
jgi:hypothetical protein